MKQITRLFTGLIFLLTIGLPQSVIAQLSEAQRQERCQNNKNRLAELESQLRVIEADLSGSMGEREVEEARTHLVYLKSIRLNKIKMNDKFDRIASLYGFKYEECFYAIRESTDKPADACIAKLETIIAAKIDKSLLVDRPALQAKKKEINKQIAEHRNNLIALECNKKTTTEGTCTLAGIWTQETQGVGITDWEIKNDGTATERGIGYAKGKASLTGNLLRIDWETTNGYSGYYEWTIGENCSGKGSLVFKTGRTDTKDSKVKRN